MKAGWAKSFDAFEAAAVSRDAAHKNTAKSGANPWSYKISPCSR